MIRPYTDEQSRLFSDWRLLTRDLMSPDSFINIAFYYMMAASMQRRVWYGGGGEENPHQLFPNIYIILVAPPAVGKGLVIKTVATILKHHKMFPQKQENNAPAFVVLKGGGQIQFPKSEPKKEAQLLIPVAAEATTYEKLLQSMAASGRSHMLEIIKDGKVVKKPYVHKSLCFCLEELSSLIKRHHDSKKIIDFLLCAYDNGDYDYLTKHEGEDRIRKMCMNFLAGTSPGFLEEAFDSSLVEEGFSSRTIFVFESVPRFVRFGVLEVMPEQIDAKKRILEHIKGLNNVFGELKYTDAAFAFMKNHVEQIEPRRRRNLNHRLDPYYGRKNIHLPKLAAAVHFSYSTDLFIREEDCKLAVDILEDIEPRMHLALNFGKNPLAKATKNVHAYIKQCSGRKVTKKELMMQFLSDIRSAELDEIIRDLTQTGKILNFQDDLFEFKEDLQIKES